jgi:hypothetical protein
MSYLWATPSVAPINPTTLPSWKLFPRKGIFTWRSSWDNDATYFSLKSGSYFGGHEHPDAGHFIVHRSGVPYITDHGYSYLKKSDEHNLVLIDGADQYGGGSQWMGSVDPSHWAKVESVLASADYFDLISDPTAMVNSTALQSWKREVVGFHPDFFIVRDMLSASTPVNMTWLLHSYKSIPPTSESSAYQYASLRTENPWAQVSSKLWTVRPQPASTILNVEDISNSTWTSAIEPSFYVPELNPDTNAYNEKADSFQVGFRLKREVKASSAVSTVGMWFGDGVQLDSWSSSDADAGRFHAGASEVAVVIWPTNGQVSAFHGFSATASLAGRRYDQASYFGRAMTKLSDNATSLVEASSPIDIFARLEHTFSAAAPGYVIVRATGQTTLKLFCPTKPGLTKLDGISTSPAWSNSVLSITVPDGEHKIEVQ